MERVPVGDLTTVAVAVLSLSVLGPPVQAQDDQTSVRSLADIRASAEAGDAEAQYDLGVRYDFGWLGVSERDAAEAVTWYRRAAEQGHAKAQYRLGVMYAFGSGVPQDHVEAFAWYRLAGAHGLVRAQYRLGAIYESGSGVPQDYVEAVTWYRRAAEQGDARAQYNLGLMYAEGKGVPQDDIEAHMWLNLAASRLTGAQRERTVTARDDVAARMTPADLSEAQRRAREWHAAHQIP